MSILASYLPEKFIQSLSPDQMNAIMNTLFSIIEDQSEISVSLKHNVLDCFGDFVLAAGAKMSIFTDKILNAIVSALGSDLLNNPDIYQYKYAIQLYVSCMSALSSMLQVLCKPSMLQTRASFSKAIPIITNHLVLIASHLGTNEEIQMSMTALIGDMSRFFPNEMSMCSKVIICISIFLFY